ncbi:MAG TPA: 4Fe-4S binding protein [Deltaproteobacteria bacterium]|nr:4Fe-4S binding protein [Deltaproteobacteria bacterium]MDI9543901.1 4Fe-4S binding protein [Pseudomonadota bacterium]HOD72527.1 4Fe-4S binding protein [Deltaproteobacteria bacterium]HOS27733.1 4Fe-4S binding protein [Deltaproteobacteria bacterium]HPA84275.1 4Fe-4S binding protein [Deltaproteobacteria bacterium]
MMSTIYETLRDRIDQYSVGFIATASGVELKILQRLFTEEEAETYLALTRKPEPVSVIAGRLGKSVEETAAVLGRMTEKGHTFPATHNGTKFYAAAPFMHGFFEHQVFRKNKDRDLPALFEEYFQTGFIPRTRSLRTVPIHMEATPETPIAPYDDVRRIIMTKERIGLFPCACNFQTASLGRKCDRPHDMCLAFDFYAEYLLDEIGFGRTITREEALKILDEAEAAGLVHQTGGDKRNTECICNCCPDCCTILRQVKLLPNPARYKSSNYVLTYAQDACKHCRVCLGRCPMQALSMSGDEEPLNVNRDRCIGCGLCTTTCGGGALKLAVKDEKDRRTPPTTFDFMRCSLDLWKEIREAAGDGE